MEYLAGLYTLLLVAICLELAVVLWRTGKKQNAAQNNEELKRWMQQQFDAQAKDLAAQQAALAEQSGYSPSHFQRVFTRHTGLSPAAYARALMAERLSRLGETGLLIPLLRLLADGDPVTVQQLSAL